MNIFLKYYGLLGMLYIVFQFFVPDSLLHPMGMPNQNPEYYQSVLTGFSEFFIGIYDRKNWGNGFVNDALNAAQLLTAFLVFFVLTFYFWVSAAVKMKFRFVFSALAVLHALLISLLYMDTLTLHASGLNQVLITAHISYVLSLLWILLNIMSLFRRSAPAHNI